VLELYVSSISHVGYCSTWTSWY